MAAVITTALIAAPLITRIDAVLPAQSFAGPVVAVAFADAQAPAALRPAVYSKPRAAGRLSTNPLSGVAMLPAAVGTSGNLRSTPELSVVAGRKPLSRRLTGWLVGDGTHSIRPFPSVTVAARP